MVKDTDLNKTHKEERMYGFQTAIYNLYSHTGHSAAHGLRLPNHGAISIPIPALEYMKRGAKGSDGQACVFFRATAMACCL